MVRCRTCLMSKWTSSNPNFGISHAGLPHLLDVCAQVGQLRLNARLLLRQPPSHHSHLILPRDTQVKQVAHMLEPRELPERIMFV